MKNPFVSSFHKPSMTKRSSKSTRRTKGPVFLGSKLLDELRILMRLASSSGTRDCESLNEKPLRSF